MHPYHFDYSSDDFWNSLKLRLAPVLGDVDVTIGTDWPDVFEVLFTRADFIAVELARHAKCQSAQWHIIDIHAAGERIIGDEDWVIAADCRDDAVAYALLQCQDNAVWPDAIRYTAATGRIELALDGEPFATIRPLGAANSVGAELRQRAQSTFYGLRKSANCNTELVKRIQRWPGLATIQLEPDMLKPREFHFPSTAEWLLSAKRLGSCVGLELTTAQAQTLVANIFEAPTWNHLCGQVHQADETASLTSFCSPWLLSGGKFKGVGDSRVFPEFLDGAVAFLEQAKLLVGAESGLTLEINPTTSLNYPQLSFLSPNLKAPEPYYDLGVERIQLQFEPVNCVSADEVGSPMVALALAGDVEHGLARLFRLKASAVERQKYRNADLARDFLAQDGGWLFTVDQLGTPDPRVYAALLDSKGNQLCAAAVYVRKGELNWHAALKAHVLSADYWGHHPVAIIYGISEAAAKLVQAQLVESSFSFRRPYPDGISGVIRKEYEEELQDLVALGGQAGWAR